MPPVSKMIRKDEVDSIEFKRDTMKGRGGIKEDVQLYGPFTYDGVKYSLYDSVYLYKDGEPDPYIGKIIELWESPTKLKKVRVLWFFRPSEISKYLRGVETLKNELFLGTGIGIDGSGLENINPLDSSRWFTGLPWEDTMKGAPEEGRLVLLQNLDPTYTSLEVEDIVWHSFRENCTAKVLYCTSIPGSHYGQAFVIFRTKQAASRAVQQLEEGCLMLPNGRPILGHGVDRLPGKSSSFPGHLFIDRLKFAMQKDKREAVATSHSSQPNTLEYDMAMEWCVLQERSVVVWKKLLKKQREELKRLSGNLKRKL